MVRIKARLEGIFALLMNPATEELLDQLDGGAATRKPKVTDESPKKKAEKKIIRNEKGQIGIPNEYLFSCLVEAGRFIKFDTRRSISTGEATLLPSFLTIEEQFFPFENQNGSWRPDRRRGILDSGGKKTAVCITRPRFDQWAFSVTLAVDEKEIALEKVRQLVEKAGTAIGLGDFRPSCRGPFGRFRVAEWKQLNGAE